MFRLVAILLASPLLASCHSGDFAYRHKQLALENVRSACSRDVEQLCSSSSRLTPAWEPDTLIFLHPVQISSMVDEMMNVALSSSSHSSSSSSRLESSDNNGFVTLSFVSSEPPPLVIFDGMLSKLFTQVSESTSASPEISLEELTKHVAERGQEILSRAEEPEGRRRLARRLTELTPEQVQRSAPFGCHYQNACLHAAYQQGAVSSPCAHAVRYLEQDMPIFLEKKSAFKNYYRQTMLPLLWIYAFLCLATLIVIKRRHRVQWKHSDKRRKTIQIIQAIFSNPLLKSQVEDQLGESLGAVPPFPRRALKKMRGNRHVCRALKITFLTSLVVMIFVAPFAVLPICIVAVFCRLCYIACFLPRIDEGGECVCCCCGGSTTNVENGTVSDKQACCTCCQGTGVCAVGCVSCCGMDSKGCDCCSDGCDCCSGGSGPGKKEVKLVGQGQKHTFACKEVAVYHGIPVQVV